MSISARDAVARAVRTGADLGLSCTDPVVLHDGSNVVVHLRPSPVVARVASRTALIRPDVEAWLARDIAVARHVAARGVAATEPLAEPRYVDGAVVALWRYEPHSAVAVEPAAVAAALAELHRALADYAGPLPAAGPVDDLVNTLDVLERSTTVDPTTLAGLRDRVAPLPGEHQETGRPGRRGRVPGPTGRRRGGRLPGAASAVRRGVAPAHRRRDQTRASGTVIGG